MNKLNYCKKCVLPDTRPNLILDDFGICDGCNSKEKKKITDYRFRKKEFEKLVLSIKSKKRKYDCVIPVSGGKDSTWQVIKALEYDLNPLCVTWKTPARNSLGQTNLQNLINLGVNHIDFSINPRVERLFTLKAFKRFGSPVIPMHMAIHAITQQIAVNFKAPLVLWGENSAFEYGGNNQKLKGQNLTYDWLKKYGVTNGTIAQDWVDKDLTVDDLSPYFLPSKQNLKKANLKAVFLGHFFSWDPNHTFNVAKKNGFISAKKPATGYYAFADIDDEFLITIHHWMKWYKFGFTRLWDNLSLEIRNNNITRKKAINIIEKTKEKNPINEIQKFCDYVKINKSDFFKIAETFRNKKIWKQKSDKTWYLNGFLLEKWNWNF